jgi:hypothetical protein
MADFLAGCVEISLVQLLLGLDVSPHGVPGLVQAIQVLQLT